MTDKIDWAACVGPGWKSLVDPLVEQCEREGVEILQVKEKFGGLRFYVGSVSGDSDLFKKIDAAEEESYKTCEECGKPGTPGGKYLVTTLCEECRTGRKEE